MYNQKPKTMAKIYGLFGSMQGKVADVVMAVRSGEQIVRKYQPIVSNPSTPAQVEQRAKLKLISQLSAVCAPVIAIRRQGVVSARNLFTKKNYNAITYSDNVASINLNNLQLTNSVVGIPPVSINRVAGENLISAVMSQSGVENLSRVVFCFFEKLADERLRLITSVVATEPNPQDVYQATIPLTTSEVVVLAYGVRDNNESARAIFGELEAPTAEQVAKIVTTSVLTERDITLTETTGATLAANRSVDPDEREEKKAKKK